MKQLNKVDNANHAKKLIQEVEEMHANQETLLIGELATVVLELFFLVFLIITKLTLFMYLYVAMVALWAIQYFNSGLLIYKYTKKIKKICELLS